MCAFVGIGVGKCMCYVFVFYFSITLAIHCSSGLMFFSFCLTNYINNETLLDQDHAHKEVITVEV